MVQARLAAADIDWETHLTGKFEATLSQSNTEAGFGVILDSDALKFRDNYSAKPYCISQDYGAKFK
ncbi:MAG: hypothetical protein HY525_06575 [Betaproteobacteria bacterium]|nr:hypothetical protein [Betaproteobacteria bacterium]